MLNAERDPTLFVHGLGFWSPRLPDWTHAAAALRGGDVAATDPPRRPTPTLLAGNGRRRAPDSVLMALQVAHEACHAAAVDPATLPSVFTSAHGELAIVDALCRSLARDPLLLSPMCFHHSVHNAASGYWAIAAGNLEASSAVAAGGCSFAAGWLEAASQCLAEQRELLLVGCDTEATGALQSVNGSRGQLAVALVLGPRPLAPTRWAVRWRLQSGSCSRPGLRSAALRSLQANAMADALPLFEALADGKPAARLLPLSATLGLQLDLQPLGAAAAVPAAGTAAAHRA